MCGVDNANDCMSARRFLIAKSNQGTFVMIDTVEMPLRQSDRGRIASSWLTEQECADVSRDLGPCY